MKSHWAGKPSEPDRPSGTAHGLLYNRPTQALIPDMLGDEYLRHFLLVGSVDS